LIQSKCGKWHKPCAYTFIHDHHKTETEGDALATEPQRFMLNLQRERNAVKSSK